MDQIYREVDFRLESRLEKASLGMSLREDVNTILGSCGCVNKSFIIIFFLVRLVLTSQYELFVTWAQASQITHNTCH